ncbi:MAG: hypothetical protein AAGH41_05990 [Pseudomonadota bacterium]
MVTRLTVGLCALVAVAGCATQSKLTIEDRLENIGLAPDRAVCMASELDDRLNDEQLAKFARFTVELDRATTTRDAIRSLRAIDDNRIAGAVAASAFSCALQ